MRLSAKISSKSVQLFFFLLYQEINYAVIYWQFSRNFCRQMHNILEYIPRKFGVGSRRCVAMKILILFSDKTIISIPLSHCGDDATKYPLRTPWHRRHGKRELFPARLSTTSRPWFAIVIALSKSLAGHSSFVAELGPEKGVVPSTTIYF